MDFLEVLFYSESQERKNVIGQNNIPEQQLVQMENNNLNPTQLLIVAKLNFINIK